jgi:hypothetical protein
MIWFLSLLPDWIFHFVVLAGVIGLLASQFFRFIPFVSQYTLPIKIVSILVLVIGIWFEGGISNNNAWLAKVKEMELKVAKAEAQSAEANRNLTSTIASKNKEIASIQVSIKNKIKEWASSMDNECKVSPQAIEVLNEAARGPKGGRK